MNNALKFIFSFNFGKYLLIGLFVFLIILTFFKNHLNYFSLVSGFNFISAIPTFLISFATAGSLLFFNKKKILAIEIVFYLFITVLATFFVFGLIQNLFVEISLIEVFLRIFGTLFVFFFLAVFFTFFLAALGDVVIVSLKKKEVQFWEKFILGLGIWALLLWPIGRFGFFEIKFLLPIFIIFSLTFWQNFLQVSKELINQKIELNNKEVLLLAIFLVVISNNFLHHFLPFPLGWDTATEYFLTVKNLIATGSLRNGILPAAIEIVLASGSVFFGMSFTSFLLLFWGSFLPIFIISFAKEIGVSRLIAIVFALTFFLLPAIEFQLSKDLKLDVILLETILVALVFWRRKYFHLSAFLLGIAVVQKLTVFFFFPAFLILIIIKKINLRSKILVILTLFLPLFVFGITNFASLNYPSLQNFQNAKEVFLYAKNLDQKIDFTEFAPQGTTGFKEEVGRYSGFSKVFFKKIVALLTSKEIPTPQKQFVDLGFWFFVLFPFFMWEFFKKAKDTKRKDLEILFLAMIFFVFWIWLGFGVPWYGFPALVILGIYFLKFITNQKLLWGVLFFSIFVGFVSRMQNFSLNPAIASVSWASFPNIQNAKRLEKKFFNAEMTVVEIVNKNLNTKIWRIGTLTKFWILDPDKRVFDDPQLDYFSIVFSEKNDLETLDFLRRNNFEFIILDRGTTSIEKNKNSSLHQKFNDFEIFARKNLKILKIEEQVILFQTPKN
jgi:hypothetical protein